MSPSSSPSHPKETTDPVAVEIEVKNLNPRPFPSSLSIITRTAVMLILIGYSIHNIYEGVKDITNSKREVRILQDQLEKLEQKANRANEALEELNRLWLLR